MYVIGCTICYLFQADSKQNKMDNTNFNITWEDDSTVIQSEEVITMENEMIPVQSEEFVGDLQTEEYSQEDLIEDVGVVTEEVMLVVLL